MASFPTHKNISRAKTLSSREILSGVYDISPNALFYLPDGALVGFKEALSSSASSIVPMVIVGDSISQGSAATNWFADAWSPLLAADMQATYGGSPSALKHTGYSNKAIPGLSAPNLVWSETGTWTRAFTGMGGVALYSLTATDKLTGTIAGENIDVILQAPGPAFGSVVNVTIDSVDKGNHSLTEATGSQVILSYTGLTDADHTVEITNVNSKLLYVNGAYGYTGTSGVRVLNVSHAGIASSSYTGADTTVLPQTLDPFGQKLTIIALGTNDCTAGVAVADYEQNITDIADRAILNGSDVFFISFSQVGTNNEIYYQYVNAITRVAINKNSPHLNMWARHFYNDGDKRLSSGFYPSTSNIHPTDTGHSDVYSAVRAVLDYYNI